jgi:replication-associated recombination protein RarA
VRVTGLGDRDEGVVSRMSVGFFTRRAQTCQQLTRMLQQNGLVMVHGPPRSGKTSLCQLMAITARHSSIFQQVFYVNCAAVSSATSFQSQFQRRCGVTFDKAAQQASESNRTLFIIYDTHRSY